MPKRTNPFQELVALIELAFAQPGDKITASVEEKVVGLTKPREIDIVRETTAGQKRIKVTFEAKDESRPFDVTDVESYIGKYFGRGNVKTDVLVIVTRRGFTKTAREKAALYAGEITLLTLDEAKSFDWASLPQHASFAKNQTLHFRPAAHVCQIRFKPPIDQELEVIADRGTTVLSTRA